MIDFVKGDASAVVIGSDLTTKSISLSQCRLHVRVPLNLEMKFQSFDTVFSLLYNKY